MSNCDLHPNRRFRDMMSLARKTGGVGGPKVWFAALPLEHIRAMSTMMVLFMLTIVFLCVRIDSTRSETVPQTKEHAHCTSLPTEAQTAFKDKFKRSFVVAAEMPFRAHLRNTGIFINAFHIPKPTSKVLDSLGRRKSPKKVTVIICRGDQESAISNYRFAADQFIMEALFLTPCQIGPKLGDVVWPKYDHPMINYLRRIRSITKGIPVIVAVPMTTREIWGSSKLRSESFEELEWMTFAAVGANYQGILWGHVRREDWWNQRLVSFERTLKNHAEDLAVAAPVGWVTGPDTHPLSAIASKKQLFVVLLNPDYMKVTPDGKGIMVPLKHRRREGEIQITLPSGCKIREGQTFLGAPLHLAMGEGTVKTKFSYDGGGTMLIFPLSWGFTGKSAKSQ